MDISLYLSGFQLEQIDLSKLIGYLNFSNGRPDARFQQTWDQAQTFVASIDPIQPWATLCNWLLEQCPALSKQAGSAFQDLRQVNAVLSLLPNKLVPGYRSFHQILDQ